MCRTPSVVIFAMILAAFSASVFEVVAQPPVETIGRRDIPPSLAPFEYLVGGWKGQGVIRDDPAQRFRGWTETHSWAWSFQQGRPSGLSVTIVGGKFIGSGKLTFDEGRKRYRLQGSAPGASDRVVLFEGTLDSTGKLLTLDRVGAADGKSGQERLTLRANGNYIRYTLGLERKGPGSVQFRRAIEVGLTKEGESFAAGSSSAERPRCVVTGGAATLTVSFKGRSFPICCTGCRDEFNENPEKYIKKLSLMTSVGAGGSKSGSPAPSRVSRFEDAFSGDVPGPRKPADERMPGRAVPKSSNNAPATAKTAERGSAPEQGRPRPDDKKSARAATLLRLGQNLEKNGKTASALTYYKQIVQDFGSTPAARPAAARIKALGDR